MTAGISVSLLLRMNVAYYERLRMLAKTEMTDQEFLSRVEELTWVRDRMIEMVKQDEGQ